MGPKYGYHPNASKTFMLVKPSCQQRARQLFAGTNVLICLDGRRHLGAALGSSSFIEDYITAKVQSWSEEMSSMANIALIHPHAAYAVFTHGLQGHWIYVFRVFLISYSHWKTLLVRVLYQL